MQQTGLVVERAEIAVPPSPAFDGPLGQGGIGLVGAVLESHHLADVGGGGKGVWKRSRIDQHDWVTALAQLDGGGHSEDSGAGNQDAIHAGAHEVGSSFATFMTVSQVRGVTSSRTRARDIRGER